MSNVIQLFKNKKPENGKGVYADSVGLEWLLTGALVAKFNHQPELADELFQQVMRGFHQGLPRVSLSADLQARAWLYLDVEDERCLDLRYLWLNSQINS